MDPQTRSWHSYWARSPRGKWVWSLHVRHSHLAGKLLRKTWGLRHRASNKAPSGNLCSPSKASWRGSGAPKARRFSSHIVAGADIWVHTQKPEMGYASVSSGGVVWAGLTIFVAPLDVTLMRDVPSRKEGFNSLVLPKGHRDLVEALVQTHSRGPRPTSGSIHDKEHEVDLVRGKGKT